jgi:hypothetical protein
MQLKLRSPDTLVVNEPQFGTITMAMHASREAQFGARITF